MRVKCGGYFDAATKKSGGPKSSALFTSLLIQQQDCLGNAAHVVKSTDIARLSADEGPLLLKR